jgi:eukaryotic-like serine/threonine-protein kinase
MTPSTDGPEAGRTKAQPARPPVSAAEVESKRGETLPQVTVAHSGPKQGLPPEFGRYRVQKLLGGGGMGAVYLVVNTELEREEALKVPHFDAAADPRVRERFLREAKAAAGLDHPNLCPVYDVGVRDGIYYLTMRYLKGKLLSEYSGSAQSPRKAVEIIARLAQALAAAHAKGVIHRDLKPNNIMMCAGVGPVVMDFGLAKQTDRQDQALTQMGTTLGTPAYMPPEQVKGELDRMGPASDVYSLGVILFQLLTGRLPFTGGTAAEVYGKILHTEAPAPSSLRPELPAALDAICAKATAKTPEGRYASMKEFAAVLIEYLKTAPAEPLSPVQVTPSVEAPPDETMTNTIGMKLKRIKAGAFKMGSPDSGQTALPDEKPRHEVEILRPFYLGVYPVTKAQFAAFVRGADYKTEAEADSDKKTWRAPGFAQTDDDPVVCVSWNDAVKFCAWLSEREKKSYALPTEAQWEYACRAGATTAYSFGDDPKLLGNYAWYWENSGSCTHPVGGRKPNPWGLYDMHGNVWEWCADYYDRKYYQHSPIKDPQTILEANARLCRGGSWYDNAEICRAACRNRIAPGSRYVIYGLRVCLRPD